MTTGIPNAGRLRKSDTENTAHIIIKSPDTEAYDKSELPDVLIPFNPFVMREQVCSRPN